jgi:hypothetical protein
MPKNDTAYKQHERRLEDLRDLEKQVKLVALPRNHLILLSEVAQNSLPWSFPLVSSASNVHSRAPTPARDDRGRSAEVEKRR